MGMIVIRVMLEFINMMLQNPRRNRPNPSSDFGPVGWNRLGEDIDGEVSEDRSGYSVSLSSDGTIVRFDL